MSFTGNQMSQHNYNMLFGINNNNNNNNINDNSLYQSHQRHPSHSENLLYSKNMTSNINNNLKNNLCISSDSTFNQSYFSNYNNNMIRKAVKWSNSLYEQASIVDICVPSIENSIDAYRTSQRTISELKNNYSTISSIKANLEKEINLTNMDTNKYSRYEQMYDDLSKKCNYYNSNEISSEFTKHNIETRHHWVKVTGNTKFYSIEDKCFCCLARKDKKDRDNDIHRELLGLIGIGQGAYLNQVYLKSPLNRGNEESFNKNFKNKKLDAADYNNLIKDIDSLNFLSNVDNVGNVLINNEKSNLSGSGKSNSNSSNSNNSNNSNKNVNNKNNYNPEPYNPYSELNKDSNFIINNNNIHNNNNFNNNNVRPNINNNNINNINNINNNKISNIQSNISNDNNKYNNKDDDLENFSLFLENDLDLNKSKITPSENNPVNNQNKNNPNIQSNQYSNEYYSQYSQNSHYYQISQYAQYAQAKPQELSKEEILYAEKLVLVPEFRQLTNDYSISEEKCVYFMSQHMTDHNNFTNAAAAFFKCKYNCEKLVIKFKLQKKQTEKTVEFEFVDSPDALITKVFEVFPDFENDDLPRFYLSSGMMVDLMMEFKYIGCYWIESNSVLVVC